MIKRRFYRFEHGDKDDPSGSSSSSSDSEAEGEATDDTEVEDDDDQNEVEVEATENLEASSSSGYESEDSSVNEVNLDSSGLVTTDDDVASQDGELNKNGSFSSGKGETELTTVQQSPEKDETDFDATCVLKRKSVFRCRLCPKIVCLSEETLKAHLTSKKHARSEKLRKEGRLKVILNDDGLLEGESLTDNPGRTVIFGQKPAKPKRKSKGPGKPQKRARQGTKFGKGRASSDKWQKKRRRDS